MGPESYPYEVSVSEHGDLVITLTISVEDDLWRSIQRLLVVEYRLTTARYDRESNEIRATMSRQFTGGTWQRLHRDLMRLFGYPV
jgi:hypothetical protein